MRNTAPDFLKINPDGLTTLRMSVIPTIRLLFVIWTNAPFLLHIREVKIDDVYGKRVREGYTFTYA